MKRIRWYYGILILAIVDTIVIITSLHTYNETIGSASHLIDQNQELVEQSRTLHVLQQRLLDVSAAINVSKAGPGSTAQNEFALSHKNLLDALESAAIANPRLQILKSQIDQLAGESQKLLDSQAQLSQITKSQNDRADLLVLIERYGRQTNELLGQSIRAVDQAIAHNTAARDELLAFHEQELGNRAAYERYFITAVLLILAGVIWFAWRLRTAHRALEEARRERLAAIGELASSVAHGIRNPLAAIQGSARLALKRPDLDDTARQRVQDILHESQRLANRVTGLLGLVRATKIDGELIDLRELVSRTAGELDVKFAERGLILHRDLPHDSLPIHGVKNQLEQIVIELLSNAIDHSKTGDTVTISCCVQDGQARICVQDQGPGVPDDIRPRIFDLFFTTRPDGTGIGLATIKRFAQLHGGDVKLENPVSGGARFIVHLPIPESGAFPRALQHSGKLLPAIRTLVHVQHSHSNTKEAIQG